MGEEREEQEEKKEKEKQEVIVISDDTEEDEEEEEEEEEEKEKAVNEDDGNDNSVIVQDIPVVVLHEEIQEEVPDVIMEEVHDMEDVDEEVDEEDGNVDDVDDDDDIYEYALNQRVQVYWKTQGKNWWVAVVTNRRMDKNSNAEYHVEFEADSSWDWVRSKKIRDISE